MVGYYINDSRGSFDNLEIATLSNTTGATVPSNESTNDEPELTEPMDTVEPEEHTQAFSNEFDGYLGLTTIDGSFTGNYAYEGSVYAVSEGGNDAFAIVNGAHFANGSISSKITLYDPIDGNNHDSGIAFRVKDASSGNDTYNGYFVGIRAGSDGTVFIGKQQDGKWTELASKSRSIDSRLVYNLNVKANGSTLSVYLNGEHMFNVLDSSFVEGDVALRVLRMPTIYQNIEITE